MEMIKINTETCSLCGTCQAICFRHLIKLENKRVDASLADSFCAHCGQCQAVCPTGALVHTGMEQEGFRPLPSQYVPGAGGPDKAEAFIDFLSTRRSQRNFKKKPVPDEYLNLIIRACERAPSSSNDACLGLVIIRNREMLDNLSLMAGRHLYDSCTGVISRLEAMAREAPLDEAQANELERARKLARFIDSAPPGQDPILYQAPVALFVHSSPYTNFPKENAMVAAHSALLAAHALGLGTCYISLMARAANENRAIQHILQTPPENQVHAVIAMGHPKYRYQRTTPARPLPVKFVGD